MSRVGAAWGGVLVVVGGVGCVGVAPTADVGKRKPYDYEARPLHPAVARVALPGDSAEWFLQMDRKELLYLRSGPGAPFVATVEAGRADGTAWTWRDTLAPGADRMLRVRWRAAGGGTDPVIRVRDVHRSTETWADVLSGDAQGRYLAGPDGWPVDGRGVAAGDTLIVRGLPFEGWNWTHAAVEPRMPAPPFAGMRSAGDTLHFVDAIPLSADAAGEARFVVAPGINLLVGDALGSPEMLVYGRSLEFPHMRNVVDLVEATRYVLSRSEYERMRSAEDMKGELDGFWLACNEDPERAADLIATYYARVEEANLYFSGLREGWRTDRGMVHIVFGVPSRIRTSPGTEWWMYGEEGNVNTVIFRFVHEPVPYDANVWTLDRSVNFRAAWDRMVTAWRTGRIQTD